MNNFKQSLIIVHFLVSNMPKISACTGLHELYAEIVIYPDPAEKLYKVKVTK